MSTKFFGNLLFVLLLILGFGLLSAARKAPPPRYVSDWVTIQPGQAQGFAHGLVARPLVVQVWVGVTLLEQEDLSDIRPWTELPEHPIFVADVTAEHITLENHGVEAWVVQVVAEP